MPKSRILDRKFMKTWGCMSLLLYLCFELIWMPIEFIGSGYTLSVWPEPITDAAACIIQSFVNTLLLYIAKRYSIGGEWKRWKMFHNAVFIIFINCVLAIPSAFLDNRVYEMTSLGHGWSISGNIIDTYILALIAAFLTISSLLLWQSEMLRNKNELLSKAEIQALRNKINPHFLFNTLNTGIALIEYDPPKAAMFFTKFSKLFRNTLDSSMKKVHSLGTELSDLHDYLLIMEVRFGKIIKTDIQLTENDMTKGIMCGSRQLVIENAIKHNTFSSEKPLTIKIRRINNALQITNNISPLINGLPDTPGRGQEIISHTYIDLGQYNVTFRNTKKEYTVELPLLKI